MPVITRRELKSLLLGACPTFEPQWRSFGKDWGRDEAEWSLTAVMHHFARHLYDLADDGTTETIAESIAVAWRMDNEGTEEVEQAIQLGFVHGLDDFSRRADETFDRLRPFVPPPLHPWWDALPRAAPAGLDSLRTYYHADDRRCSRCGCELEPPGEEKQLVNHAAGPTEVYLCAACERHYRQFYKIFFGTIGLLLAAAVVGVIVSVSRS